jgi:hypothetical protein
MPLVYEWEYDDWQVTGLYGRDVSDDLWERYQATRAQLEEIMADMMECPFVDNRPELMADLPLTRTGIVDFGDLLGPEPAPITRATITGVANVGERRYVWDPQEGWVES